MMKSALYPAYGDDRAMEHSLFDKAIKFAVDAHSGDHRKGTDIPYIVHPLETAAIVATMTADDEVLAAAVLHDVVEDAGVTREEIANRFGDRVAALVADESEDKREHLPAESTWMIRKKETMEHLKKASTEARMIALGDKLSNIRAIVRDYERLGDALWERFNQKDPALHGWYYGSIAIIIGNDPALSRVPALSEYRKLVEKVFG